MLNKKQMSEEDVKLNYITPVILKGWNDGRGHGGLKHRTKGCCTT